MALMQVAPWIVPPNYLEAMHSGAGLGLQSKSIDQQAAEAAARIGLGYAGLAQRDREVQLEQQSAADRLKAAQAQHASDQEALNAYRWDRLGIDRAKILAGLDRANQKKLVHTTRGVFLWDPTTEKMGTVWPFPEKPGQLPPDKRAFLGADVADLRAMEKELREKEADRPSGPFKWLYPGYESGLEELRKRIAERRAQIERDYGSQAVNPGAPLPAGPSAQVSPFGVPAPATGQAGPLVAPQGDPRSAGTWVIGESGVGEAIPGAASDRMVPTNAVPIEGDVLGIY